VLLANHPSSKSRGRLRVPTNNSIPSLTKSAPRCAARTYSDPPLLCALYPHTPSCDTHHLFARLIRLSVVSVASTLQLERARLNTLAVQARDTHLTRPHEAYSIATMNYMNAPPTDGANAYNMFAPSPLMNQHRRAFSGFSADGSPLPPSAIPAGLFADDLAAFDLSEANEHGDPKRSRIARVCGHDGVMLTLESDTDVSLGRLAICAGKRKSSAMGSSQHVHIVRTTKRNASSLRWKRSVIRRKGELPFPQPLTHHV
jgi:hypothetical protein